MNASTSIWPFLALPFPADTALRAEPQADDLPEPEKPEEGAWE